MPPTPPKTTHKRKRRSRSRVTDSSSEESDQEQVPEPESDGEEEKRRAKAGEIVLGHKKRRTLTVDAIAEELSETKAEDMFWMGESAAGSSVAAGGPAVKNRAPTRPSRARSRTRSPSLSPPPAPYMLRKGHSGLMSPPPSRRAPTIVPRPATPPPQPKPSKAKGKEPPQRDSPNNPFLMDDSPGSVPPSGEDLSSPEPRTPKKHAEKPVITYVLCVLLSFHDSIILLLYSRGTRMLMANPHNLSPEAAAEVEARSRLPIDHPEYIPSEACPPKLLFPEARRYDLRRRTRATTVLEPASPTPAAGRRRAGSSSSDGSRKAGPSAAGPPDVDERAMAAAMVSRVTTRMRKGVFADGEAPSTRPSSQHGGSPRPPEKDQSDPVKRALGPYRTRKA